YQVGLTIVGADGCSDAQLQEVEITTLTSVQEPPPGLEIGIFPNPFQSTLQVDLRTSGELEVEAELLDLNGRTVRRFGLLPAGLAQLSLGELPAGIYLLRLRQSDWQWTEKVIKMNR
ncbi:MAG: T9SS type A sorting domain-containing protein, partial [Saprospiraceae bacterium]|nr:T9SS type A sorting domain-containing protein [Saprospiraceae bacterium]